MNGIIDSISNLLMPLCSVWIVNKFVNNSFEKKESKKIFTRIIWGLFILIQIVMETEKGNVSIQKGIISFFVILGIIIIGYKGTFQRKLLFTSLFISIWILSEFFVYFILKWGGIKQKGGKNKLVREISLESLWEKGIEISTDDTVWSIIEKEIDLEKLYVAIHRLDIWEKIVLQKIFWEGLSEKRIAEELNISRSTLNYRKGKIYKKIREEVEKGKY